jgi:hypothetical protein
MKIKIHVTKEILKSAMYCPSGSELTVTNCAIALATREIFPKARVERFNIQPFGAPDDDENSIIMTREAIGFISAFDAASPPYRATMQPFSFEVNVHEHVINRIGISQVEKILSESLTLEKS